MAKAEKSSNGHILGSGLSVVLECDEALQGKADAYADLSSA